MKPLQIFKPGKHTASDGRVLTFTEAQLKGCAAAYDPAVYEAPLVIGHPKSDAPAYGWAKTLAFAETLDVEPHQVDAEFAEMVNKGYFKKVSASFWLPDAPGNPKPGALYLRHVGFLGAQPPAVKGLKSASFADAGDGVVEFMDWSKRDIATLFRGLRDFLIGKFGQDEADKAIPSYMVDSIQEDAVKDAVPSPSYSEGDTVETKEQIEARVRAELEAKHKADREQLERDRTEFAEQKRREGIEKVRRDCVVFVDAQVKEGRVLPAHRDGLVAFMAALPGEGVVEFGEGDKAVKKPSAEWFRGYLAAQPKVVDFTERGDKGVDRIDDSNPVKAANEIARRAVEFQESEKKAGRVVSIDMAVKHITQGENA